tara:strand:+ start:253 stop:6345 length:6093 start_codon:yes stop_codon:yes gene_type:complete
MAPKKTKEPKKASPKKAAKKVAKAATERRRRSTEIENKESTRGSTKKKTRRTRSAPPLSFRRENNLKKRDEPEKRDNKRKDSSSKSSRRSRRSRDESTNIFDIEKWVTNTIEDTLSNFISKEDLKKILSPPFVFGWLLVFIAIRIARNESLEIDEPVFSDPLAYKDKLIETVQEEGRDMLEEIRRQIDGSCGNLGFSRVLRGLKPNTNEITNFRFLIQNNKNNTFSSRDRAEAYTLSPNETFLLYEELFMKTFNYLTGYGGKFEAFEVEHDELEQFYDHFGKQYKLYDEPDQDPSTHSQPTHSQPGHISRKLNEILENVMVKDTLPELNQFRRKLKMTYQYDAARDMATDPWVCSRIATENGDSWGLEMCHFVYDVPDLFIESVFKGILDAYINKLNTNPDNSQAVQQTTNDMIAEIVKKNYAPLFYFITPDGRFGLNYPGIQSIMHQQLEINLQYNYLQKLNDPDHYFYGTDQRTEIKKKIAEHDHEKKKLQIKELEELEAVRQDAAENKLYVFKEGPEYFRNTGHFYNNMTAALTAMKEYREAKNKMQYYNFFIDTLNKKNVGPSVDNNIFYRLQSIFRHPPDDYVRHENNRLRQYDADVTGRVSDFIKNVQHNELVRQNQMQIMASLEEDEQMRLSRPRFEERREDALRFIKRNIEDNKQRYAKSLEDNSEDKLDNFKTHIEEIRKRYESLLKELIMLGDINYDGYKIDNVHDDYDNLTYELSHLMLKFKNWKEEDCDMGKIQDEEVAKMNEYISDLNKTYYTNLKLYFNDQTPYLYHEHLVYRRIPFKVEEKYGRYEYNNKDLITAITSILGISTQTTSFIKQLQYVITYAYQHMFKYRDHKINDILNITFTSKHTPQNHNYFMSLEIGLRESKDEDFYIYVLSFCKMEQQYDANLYPITHKYVFYNFGEALIKIENVQHIIDYYASYDNSDIKVDFYQSTFDIIPTNIYPTNYNTIDLRQKVKFQDEAIEMLYLCYEKVFEVRPKFHTHRDYDRIVAERCFIDKLVTNHGNDLDFTFKCTVLIRDLINVGIPLTSDNARIFVERLRQANLLTSDRFMNTIGLINKSEIIPGDSYQKITATYKNLYYNLEGFQAAKSQYQNSPDFAFDIVCEDSFKVKIANTLKNFITIYESNDYNEIVDNIKSDSSDQKIDFKLLLYISLKYIEKNRRLQLFNLSARKMYWDTIIDPSSNKTIAKLQHYTIFNKETVVNILLSKLPKVKLAYGGLIGSFIYNIYENLVNRITTDYKYLSDDEKIFPIQKTATILEYIKLMIRNKDLENSEYGQIFQPFFEYLLFKIDNYAQKTEVHIIGMIETMKGADNISAITSIYYILEDLIYFKLSLFFLAATYIDRDDTSTEKRSEDARRDENNQFHRRWQLYKESIIERIKKIKNAAKPINIEKFPPHLKDAETGETFFSTKRLSLIMARFMLFAQSFQPAAEKDLRYSRVIVAIGKMSNFYYYPDDRNGQDRVKQIYDYFATVPSLNGNNGIYLQNMNLYTLPADISNGSVHESVEITEATSDGNAKFNKDGGSTPRIELMLYRHIIVMVDTISFLKRCSGIDLSTQQITTNLYQHVALRLLTGKDVDPDAINDEAIKLDETEKITMKDFKTGEFVDFTIATETLNTYGIQYKLQLSLENARNKLGSKFVEKLFEHINKLGMNPASLTECFRQVYTCTQSYHENQKENRPYKSPRDFTDIVVPQLVKQIYETITIVLSNPDDDNKVKLRRVLLYVCIPFITRCYNPEDIGTSLQMFNEIDMKPLDKLIYKANCAQILIKMLTNKSLNAVKFMNIMDTLNIPHKNGQVDKEKFNEDIEKVMKEKTWLPMPQDRGMRETHFQKALEKMNETREDSKMMQAYFKRRILSILKIHPDNITVHVYNFKMKKKDRYQGPGSKNNTLAAKFSKYAKQAFDTFDGFIKHLDFDLMPVSDKSFEKLQKALADRPDDISIDSINKDNLQFDFHILFFRDDDSKNMLVPGFKIVKNKDGVHGYIHDPQDPSKYKVVVVLSPHVSHEIMCQLLGKFGYFKD